MKTVEEIKRIIQKKEKEKKEKSELTQNQEIVSLHAKVIQRLTNSKIIVEDNTGRLQIKTKQRSPLIRSGEKLSFANLQLSRKGAAITYVTTIEKLKSEDNTNLKNIESIPEKKIRSNHLFKLNLYQITIYRLFLNIHSVSKPVKSEENQQYKQEIICYDNENVVTIILQCNVLINFYSQNLKKYNCCMIQDFIIMERYEYNATVKIVKNVSTFNLFNTHIQRK